MSVPTPRKMIGGTYRLIGQRYGDRHSRTVKRWIAGGEFPPPDLIINGRPYWYETTLNEFDRQRVIASLSQPRQRQSTPPALKRTTSSGPAALREEEAT